jgi:hypothetical protein
VKEISRGFLFHAGFSGSARSLTHSMEKRYPFGFADGVAGQVGSLAYWAYGTQPEVSPRGGDPDTSASA